MMGVAGLRYETVGRDITPTDGFDVRVASALRNRIFDESTDPATRIYFGFSKLGDSCIYLKPNGSLTSWIEFADLEFVAV
jgi:hypothetical protein